MHRLDFDAYLTDHFQLGEFALWVPGRAFKHEWQITTASRLAVFLEQVRNRFAGRPVRITSGYRPPEVNRSVGGAVNSEHLFSMPGEGAVDFWIPGKDTAEVQEYCDTYWPHSVGLGADRGFVHVGMRADNKRRRWPY